MPDDLLPLARSVLERARARNTLIVTAESCTGGLAAAALTEIAGASDVVLGGFVTYSNAAKEALLGVEADTLARVGAVSEEVAREMAAGARARGRDMAAGVGGPGAHGIIAVSVTGIAGPGGSGRKPEGRVCFGVADENGVHAETVEFGAPGRAVVRRRAAVHALELFLAHL